MESAKWWMTEHPSVAKFRWTHGVTFAASYSFMTSAALGYLVLIFTLHSWMKRRPNPVSLGPIPVLHNIILSVGSLFMFVGCLQASALQTESSRWIWGKKPAWNWLLCFPRGTVSAGPVFFWSYIYYLSKFYELVDTIIALLTNTGVHVVMYTYYFLCSVGRPPAWKKLVTNLQIVQFVFSFVASIGTLWFHFRGEGCSGMGAWLFNAVFNASLLMLFLNFHGRQYRKRQRSDSEKEK
ncbi:hypothetical protein R1sor_006894 [Riccia sorocarpa]|uniref:very-long-chain 3-oxoacyl-CoA synthase n=1 Tax=Riccia sorocarpa TaxID=122646 RepID=A0ABD3HNQ5_9MARC